MSIEELVSGIEELASLPTDERIEAINRLMIVIGAIHPNTDPVSCIRWVPAEMVEGNLYNPNHVAPPEMRMLHVSIKSFGYTQPIVAFYDPEKQKYVIVDGFHRKRVGTEYRDVRERVHGYLPIVVIDKPLAERIKATYLANMARGRHETVKEADNMAILSQVWSDEEISKHMGMDADTVLRLKRVTGIPELFKNRSYSRSWILDPERTKNGPQESSDILGEEHDAFYNDSDHSPA